MALTAGHVHIVRRFERRSDIGNVLRYFQLLAPDGYRVNHEHSSRGEDSSKNGPIMEQHTSYLQDPEAMLRGGKVRSYQGQTPVNPEILSQGCDIDVNVTRPSQVARSS